MLVPLEAKDALELHLPRATDRVGDRTDLLTSKSVSIIWADRRNHGGLLESVTLGLLGGAVGVGASYAGLRLLIAIGPENLPRLNEISLDGRSFVFTLILS